jgi:hypothetical protein
MSYDVYFESDAAEEGAEWADPWRNYTSNTSAMWADALGENLGDLIERCSRPADLLPHVVRGILAMRADPAKFAAMNPKNGWGNYEGALAYLEWLAAACRYYPERKVRVSR